jgi:ABC-type oligopeptide transport system substrate-binding subunit
MHLGHADREIAGQAAAQPVQGLVRNLECVVPEGDHAVTFELTRSQPAFLMLLASGMSPVYPCHVSSREMRTHPIGTGPFNSPNSSRTNTSGW